MVKEIMSTINFEAKLFEIGSWTILQLPEEASAQLPSRGQVMATAVVNDYKFQTPLEPDGQGSHWFAIDKDLHKAANIQAGDAVSVAIEPTKQWPEPEVPTDWAKAIAADKVASELWPKITPLARWEWIRWVRATNNVETRARRIQAGISKMNNGERRPCCWNRNLCTVPEVSKNGVLLAPTPA